MARVFHVDIQCILDPLQSDYMYFRRETEYTAAMRICNDCSINVLYEQL